MTPRFPMLKSAAAWLGLLLAVVQCDDYNSASHHGRPPFGGALLNAALNWVLQPNQSQNDAPFIEKFSNSFLSNNSLLQRSSIRIRCEDYLACEYPLQAVEIDNAIFYNGVLFLADIDEASRSNLLLIQKMYGTRLEYLPSTMVQHKSAIYWLHGPKVALYDSAAPSAPIRGGLLKCVKTWNTSAHFLHPWEINNAYHSLNDNIMSVLSSIILQHITPVTDDANYVHKAEGSKSLFLFNRMSYSTHLKTSLLFGILNWIFEGDVRPAKEILQGFTT